VASFISTFDPARGQAKPMRFFAGFIATLLALGLGANRALELGPAQEPYGFPPGSFVSYYKGIGIDYNMFRYGLFGEGARLRQADIILYSSSKGVFAYRADMLGSLVEKATGRPVRAFNASLAFSEGIPFFVQIVKSLDLRDKLIVIDLAGESYRWEYSEMARAALKQSLPAAYTDSFNTWLHYLIDRGLNPFVPDLKPTGWAQRASYAYSRSFATGDETTTVFAPRVPIPQPQPFQGRFDEDGRLGSGFVEEFRQRNLAIVFTTIPYGGGPIDGKIVVDPTWGRKVAEDLGLPYLEVSWGDLYTVDGMHMDAKSAYLFTHRLAGELSRALLQDRRLLSPHGSQIYRRVSSLSRSSSIMRAR
jgi:hypothetical protein